MIGTSLFLGTIRDFVQSLGKQLTLLVVSEPGSLELLHPDVRFLLQCGPRSPTTQCSLTPHYVFLTAVVSDSVSDRRNL